MSTCTIPSVVQVNTPLITPVSVDVCLAYCNAWVFYVNTFWWSSQFTVSVLDSISIVSKNRSKDVSGSCTCK